MKVLVQRVLTFTEVEREWECLLPQSITQNVFLTPHWQRVWWQTMRPQTELQLLALRRQGQLLGLVPMMAQGGTLLFLGDTDLFDYHDFIVRRGEEEPFYMALLDHLREEAWQRVELSSIPASSPTLDYLPRLAEERGYRVELCREDVCPGLSLGSTWEHYLSGLGRKDRHELRRKLRRLYGAGNPRHYFYTQAEEISQGLDTFFRLLRESREDKHHFLTPEREEFFKRVALELAALGYCRLYFLELEGQKVASTLCFDYGPCRFLYNSGYDPRYASLSVGLLLKALCVKDAIEEGKLYFDFLRGGEPYKYHLGAKERPLYRLRLYAPGISP